MTGDGILDQRDFQYNDGWYYYTGYDDDTIFFGGTTGRSTDGFVRYYHQGYIWTAARDKKEVPGSGNGARDFHYTMDCSFPWCSAPRHALTVHPVAE